MKVVNTEKVFLTVNELSTIVQFETIVEEINRRAQSEGLHNACTNVLINFEVLSDYIFPE